MINTQLIENILEVHRNKIGNPLFLFLFEDILPLQVDNENFILAVDSMSLPFLANGEYNYNQFKTSISQVLFTDNFNLAFTEHKSNNIKLPNLNQNNSINQEININQNIMSNKQKNEDINKEVESSFNSNTNNDKQNNDFLNNNIQVEENKSPANLNNFTKLNSESSTNLNNIDETTDIQNSKSENISTELYVNNLSNNLTFNNFFYSYENKQIIDAAKLLIETIDNPQFNPFFIYGASGIGKTHILNAIGNQIVLKYPKKHIFYLHSQLFIEEYTSLFTGGINNTNKIEEFKTKYNNIDVLLIDDIQHLESKEGTISEFFGIFEKMRNNNKIVVIASDKHPEKINFEERLITRFVSGITCEMKIPDSNTKKEIFYYHAKERDFRITDSAVDVFIQNSKNVRALIGYLNAITLYSISNDLNNSQIDENIANMILNKNNGIKQELTDDDIIKIIADYFQIKISDIRSKKRKHNIVNARHFSAYFLRNHLNLKHSKIAYCLGFRDHSAALNAIKSADEKIKKDEYKETFEKLNRIIKN